jgi:hypothetical protein
MGLDNIIYEKRGVKDKQLSEILAPLGSGIMVDDSNSFRGKMYDGFISDITGYSLYETDDWTHEDIEKVIVSLKDYKNNFDKIIFVIFQRNDNFFYIFMCPIICFVQTITCNIGNKTVIHLTSKRITVINHNSRP